jgi:hypothetical protein
MRTFRCFFTLAAFLVLTACPSDKTTGLKVVNKAGRSIRLLFVEWPDTAIDCSLIDLGNQIVSPQETVYLYYDGGASEKAVKEPLYRKGYISFLAIDNIETVRYWDEPCDTIRKYVPVLHRYRYTIEELERMNWTVVYPPEEE